MIRNGDIVEAHQWSTASYEWQKVGEVVDAVGSDKKQKYKGKEYDYVFDIDISGDDQPGSMLKLPYNVTGMERIDFRCNMKQCLTSNYL